ncbi:MAG: hypothetical protein KIT73_00960, partial [Burkholderiales bacterium]|nr:hypothetical protein [Burkholderiales bacterium]
LTLPPLLGACSSFGPHTIARDRFDYQDALGRSMQEQFLANLVKMRYGDAPVFLDVASVINSYSIEGEVALNGGSEAGFSRNFFGGTARYGDRPTITYNPIQGDAFARSILQPLPPAVVFTFVQSGYQIDYVLRLTARSVNGIHNSNYVGTRRIEADPAFHPLMNALHRIQTSNTVALYLENREGSTDPGLYFDIPFSAGDYQDELQLVIQTLGLDPRAPRYALRYGVAAENPQEIAMLTRSLFEVFVDVASTIDVPAEHVAARRVVATSPEQGLQNPDLPPERFAKPLIGIHSSRERPDDAAVAIRYRGWWFHIADNDVRSKRLFGFLLLLFGLADGRDTARGPIVTVPTR